MNDENDVLPPSYQIEEHKAQLATIVDITHKIIIELHNKIAEDPSNRSAIARHKIIKDQLENVQRHIEHDDVFGLQIELPLLKSELSLAGVEDVDALFENVIPHLLTAEERRDLLAQLEKDPGNKL